MLFLLNIPLPIISHILPFIQNTLSTIVIYSEKEWKNVLYPLIYHINLLNKGKKRVEKESKIFWNKEKKKIVYFLIVKLMRYLFYGECDNMLPKCSVEINKKNI